MGRKLCGSQSDIAWNTGDEFVFFAVWTGLPSDIAFDIESSVTFDGDSGPYLQYTYARAQSVLRKARNSKHEARNKSKNSNVLNFKNSDLDIVSNFDIRISDLNAEESAILRWLYRFPEVVITAGERYEPSQICTYLYELSQRFNSFYNKHQILGNDLRLGLTAAVGQVVKNGLWVLGIKAPEKM